MWDRIIGALEKIEGHVSGGTHAVRDSRRRGLGFGNCEVPVVEYAEHTVVTADEHNVVDAQVSVENPSRLIDNVVH